MIDKLENKPRPQQFYLWKGFVLCSIIILYQGCSRTSEEEKLKIYQEIFQEVTYDKRIDQHNKAFEDLNLFLYPKLDEILKFKNVKHIMGGGDTTRVSYRERNDMTLVYKNIDENVPPEYTD